MIIKALQPFKRGNFFNGLLATPQFWNEIQDYHFQKEQFYNTIFHGEGIIAGIMGQLKVKALKGNGGVFTLVADSGAAIDRRGRCIFLYEPQAITLDCKKYKLPTTVYVTVRYDEIMDDFFQNADNMEFQGYRKRVETAKVELLQTIPETGDYLELARIYIQENEKGEIREITEPASFAEPGSNALDFRYLRWSAPARQGLSPYLKDFLTDLLDLTRNVAQVSYDAVHLQGLRELQTLALTAKMLVQCGDVSFDEIINILYPLYDIANQITQEMLEYERQEDQRIFSTKDVYAGIQQAVHEMGDIIKYFDHSYEQLDQLLKTQRRVIEGLRSLFVTRQMSLQDIGMMSHELPRILVLGSERYTLVDYMDLRDADNVTSHQLDFIDCTDVSTANLSLSYPDGTVVRDTVRSYVGGTAQFSLRHVVKNRKLLLIRRTDVIAGNYSVQVNLDDAHGKQLLIDAPDSKYRWRNLSVVFDEDMVGRNAPFVSFELGGKGRDNFGRIWVYQAL